MKDKKGFTLIEVLAIISIIGILAILVVPNVLNVYEKAKIEAFKTSVKSISKSIDNYVFEKDNFPDEGINVSDLNITNKESYSGKFIKNENGNIEADLVSDGVYCAKGEMENLYVEKGCENLDTTSPTNVAIIISEQSSSSVRVIGSAIDNESNIVKYEFKIDSGNYIDKGDTNIHTFTGLTTGSHTIHLRVTNGKGLTSETSIDVNLTTLVAPTYSVSPTGWSGNKTVTITYPARETGFIYSYSIDNGDTWTEVPSGTTVDVVFNTNGTLIGKVYDGTNFVTSSQTISQIDNTPPVITLNGSSSITIPVGTPYVDQGAVATDNADTTKNVTGVLPGNFDTSKTGTYVITYDTKDSANNSAATVTRQVIVTTTTIVNAATNTVLPGCTKSGSTYIGSCRVTGGYDANEDRNDLVNNYVWYSGFIWRIVNVNSDGTVKMVTEGNVANSPYSTSSTGAKTFDSSEAKTWLNTYFLSKLKGTDILVSSKWCIEATASTITALTSARTTCATYSTNNYKLGLLTLDEFNLSGGATGSYLFNGGTFFTATAFSTEQLWGVVDSYSTYTSNKTMSVIPLYYTSHLLGMRPTANVTASTIVTKGNGSKNNPYVLNEYKDSEITNKTLSNQATVGEYVKMADKYYRIIDVGATYTKLTLDSITYNESGFALAYNNLWNTASLFTTASDANSMVGYTLNTSVYNWLAPDDTTKNKIVSTTWYRGATMTSSVSTWTYSQSLANSNSVGSIKVGLPKLGEILSGAHASMTMYYRHRTDLQSVGYNGFKTEYYMNYGSYYALPIRHSSSGAEMSGNGTTAVRPVIFVNSSLPITGGTGLFNNPYQI